MFSKDFLMFLNRRLIEVGNLFERVQYVWVGMLRLRFFLVRTMR